MKLEKKHVIYILALFVVLLVAGFDGDEEEVVAENTIKEVIVEREVEREVLKIRSNEHVCHNGERHWAVYYQKPDGELSWFIAASPGNKSCNGEEKVHPSIRDKIAKEDAEKKKKQEAK